MKTQKLFLTSSILQTAESIGKKLDVARGLKLAFIITASEEQSEDELDWRHDDRKALVDAGFLVTDYTITGKTPEKIRDDLSAFDVLHFEGGNPFYLMEKIQDTACAEIIRELVTSGKIYIGSSAGSTVAGPDVLPVRHRATDEFPKLKKPRGLCLVDFVIFPHFGSEFRRKVDLGGRLEHNYDEKLIRIFLTDNQYVEVEGDWMRIVDVSAS